jgi:competence protein ComEA
VAGANEVILVRSIMALNQRVIVLWLASAGVSLCLATEINQATEAELDSVKGFGPASTARILEARTQALFKDWADLMRRVKGIKPAQAAKLSEAGLRVNGKNLAGEDAP